MAVHEYTPVRGRVARITTLDKCGRVTTSSKFTVSEGFISLKFAPNVEEGTEIVQKNFGGKICVNDTSPSEMKSISVELEFCGVQPSVVTALTNAQPYNDHAGDLAGFTLPSGRIEKMYALELWTGLSGASCASGADEASAYVLLPFCVAGVPSEISVESESAVTFGMTGSVTKDGSAWGAGPYDVVYNASNQPAPLPQALTSEDHLLIIDTGLAAPAVQPELTAVPGITTTTTTP